MTLILGLALLADPMQELQGTWTSASGTVIFVDDDEVFVGKNEEGFEGRVAFPTAGVLQIVVGGEVAVEVVYELRGDKLVLTIDDSRIEYTRKAKRRGV